MKTEEKEETRLFYPLTNDLLFKESYGNPANIRHLEDLLECYFNYPEGYLKDKLDVNYESYFEKLAYGDKSVRGDLMVVIENKFIVQIEMYQMFDKSAAEKSEHYIMRIAATSLKIGDKYDKIKKITQINFADSTIKTYSDLKTVINFSYYENTVEGHIINLDKAREISYTENSERFLKLLKFIGAKTREERIDLAEGDEKLMDFNAWLDAYSNSELVKNGLSDIEWNNRIYYNRGKDEKAKNIAINMLKKDSTLEFISEVTGLSLDEISELQQELDKK